MGIAGALKQLASPQQVGELGNVRRNPSRLIFRQQFRADLRPCVYSNLAQGSV